MRLERLIDLMTQHDMEHLIVSDPVAIEYLTEVKFKTDERLLIFLVDAAGQHRFFLNQLIPVADFPFPVEWYSDTDRPIERLAQVLGEGKIGIDKNWPAHFFDRPVATKADCSAGTWFRLDRFAAPT